MKILCVHGVGHADQNPEYYQPWMKAIRTGLESCGYTGEPAWYGFHYDDLFDKHYSGPGVYSLAIAEFLGSAAVQGVTNWVHGLFRPSRDFAYLSQDVRWAAGMVAQLAVEGSLRKELRARLLDAINEFQPDVVAAHSLGTLITYDFLAHEEKNSDALARATYITFGAQINNTFVRSRLFPEQIRMPKVKFWYHLFNPQDPVLTAPIRLKDEKFLQVEANSPAGHSAINTGQGPGYLDHPNTRQFVWSALASPTGARQFKQNFAITRHAAVKPHRRALLIGINEYPDPANRLEGCVNDVFLMSSALQERGFDPEDIRVVLNDRATAQGIRDRLTWLLDGAGDGMERVLFYSGHGAQMPGYNALEIVDHMDECLVPFDFNWTKDTAITDDDFYQLYSDLPYGAKFFGIFDCCHSGGMTREGSRKVRGITPPDDIRHRMLQWNQKEQMWTERPLTSLNEDFGGTETTKTEFMGRNRATYRLGRAMRLRTQNHQRYVRQSKVGAAPYMPVLLEACREGQLSYEYRHGVTSYGAFTYSLVKNLRAKPKSTFAGLIKQTAQTLKSLEYDQNPQLVGPGSVLHHLIPGAAK